MPRKLEIDALKTELAQVNELLTEAEQHGDVVGKLQYAERVEMLQSALQELNGVIDSAASIAVFFGGKPVFGSHGIEIDFAGKALQNFQNIVTTSFSTSNLGRLGARGKLPQGDQAALMLTDISRGSFGFVLDEVLDQSEMFDTNLKEAVEFAIEAIIKSSAEDDDGFDELTEELDPRILIALEHFFQELDRKEATLRLVDSAREYSLDSSAVKRGRDRTEHTKVTEENTELQGELRGLLPSLKKFEMALANNEVINGSASEEAVATYEARLEEGKSTVGEQSMVELIQRIVQPRNRPSKTVYRLVKFLKIGNDEIPQVPSEPEGGEQQE